MRSKVTPSIKAAIDALDLSEVIVIHAGRQSYPIGKKIIALAATEIVGEIN